MKLVKYSVLQFLAFLVVFYFPLSCSGLNRMEFESQEEENQKHSKRAWLKIVKGEDKSPSAKNFQKILQADKIILAQSDKKDLNKKDASGKSEPARSMPPDNACVFKRENILSKPLKNEAAIGVRPLSQEFNPRLWKSEKSEALKYFPRDKTGDYVDWVSSVDLGLITPRGALEVNGEDKPMLNLDILFEVKNRKRNNVCFPHSIHTYWFNCENCHPEIFVMKKGGNPISMLKIIKGEYCGRCHGKVAFHVANNCERCHNTPKKVKSVLDLPVR